MKRFFLFVLLTAFSLSGIAQSGIYSGGVSGIVEHDLRKTGWVIRPELGFAYGEDWDHISGIHNEKFFTFSADAGYQITPRIYFGGGLGCFLGRDTHSYYNSNTGLFFERLHDKVFPLYASFRWYWFDGLSSPFLELSAGGELSKGDGRVVSSYYVNPAIGMDVRNIDIKISFPFFYGGGVAISIGYNFLVKTR